MCALELGEMVNGHFNKRHTRHTHSHTVQIRYKHDLSDAAIDVNNENDDNVVLMLQSMSVI